jgi:hypothetical protein
MNIRYPVKVVEKWDNGCKDVVGLANAGIHWCLASNVAESGPSIVVEGNPLPDDKLGAIA